MPDADECDLQSLLIVRSKRPNDQAMIAREIFPFDPDADQKIQRVRTRIAHALQVGASHVCSVLATSKML